MKNLHILVIFFFLPFLVFGQINSNQPIALNSNNMSVVSNKLSYYQINDIPNKNVKGSPYYFPEWKSGYIVTLDGTSLMYDKILFDIEKNRIIVESDNSKEKVVLFNKTIIGFYINNNSKDIRYFKKIFPLEFNLYDSNRNIGYYEIFQTDSDNLLKYTKTILLYPNNLGYSSYSGTSSRMKYKKTYTYFIKKKNKKYYKCKLKRKNIIRLLSEKGKEVTFFVKKNKLSYSKELDVVKIIDYYHSLK